MTGGQEALLVAGVGAYLRGMASTELPRKVKRELVEMLRTAIANLEGGDK